MAELLLGINQRPPPPEQSMKSLENRRDVGARKVQDTGPSPNDIHLVHRHRSRRRRRPGRPGLLSIPHSFLSRPIGQIENLLFLSFTFLFSSRFVLLLILP